jgi:amino acid transporter
MNRWAKIQIALAGIGTLLFFVAGWQGFAVPGRPENFPLHTQLGLVATLTILLGFLWVVVYLLASGRLLRTRAGLAPEALRQVRRASRGALLGALVAAVATVAHFFLAGRLFGSSRAAHWHLWSAIVTALLLVLALVLAGRGLTRHQRLLVPRKAGGRVLDSAGS